MNGKLRRISTIIFSRIFFILGGLVVIYFGVYFCIQVTKPALFIFQNTNVRTPCLFQQPDPFDRSIAKFNWVPQPLECDETPSLVSIDVNNTLRINVTTLKTFDINNESDIVCEIQTIVRNQDDQTVSFTKASVIKLPTILTSDFSRVTCKSNDGYVLYDNVVVAVMQKQSLPQTKTIDKDKLNVILFGMDSVSHAASVRHLPKTRAMLQRLGAYDFEGYMKVGENTAPNLIPLLTGNKLDGKEFSDNEDLDTFPFLWKQFAENGYQTLMAEDMPHISPFNNRFLGFRKPPTDHYMRPFWLAQKQMDKFKDDMSSVYRFLESKGINIKKTSVFCYQNTKKHVLLVNYIRQFFFNYRNTPKFSFTFLTELSHSYTNFLTYGDEDFAGFFHWLNAKGFFNNTILIVFGDHGPRYEHYRNTFVGRIESRMPFLSIVVPGRIKRKYPDIHESLKTNTKRLVTLFDVHQTIIDVLKDSYEKPSIQYTNGGKRGVSLFQPVSSTRSCLEAGVPEEYCACYRSTPLNVTQNTDVEYVSNHIVKHINEMTSKTKLCESLKLFKILSAQQMELGLEHKETVHNKYSLFRFSKPERGNKRYSVTLETVPGHAQFDATCEYNKGTGIKVIGEIDRINKYGNQSACIYTSDVMLRQYCYCKT